MIDRSNRSSVDAAPPPASDLVELVAADCQDPLPESNWLYRRWLVFAGEAFRMAALAFILFALYRLAAQAADPTEAVRHLYRLGVALVILSLVDRILYLIAPSAEQATKMMATVSAWRAGVLRPPQPLAPVPASPAEVDAAPRSRT
jgi:hypothetical protein